MSNTSINMGMIGTKTLNLWKSLGEEDILKNLLDKENGPIH